MEVNQQSHLQIQEAQARKELFLCATSAFSVI